MIRLFTNQNHYVAVQNSETVFISKMFNYYVPSCIFSCGQSQLNKGIIIIIVIMWC